MEVGDARGHWLIFGATGGVGRRVRARLDAIGADCTCVTRGTAPPASGARWITGALPGLDIDLDASCDVLASLGPLDAFSLWLERASLAGVRRVVALSSTSVHSKRASPDPDERALAATLAESEARVAARCESLGVAWTILRPTLVYGGGDDRSLARIAVIARRVGFFVLPSGARGLRAPVHADDVAAAVIAASTAPAASNRAYDLPGGEPIAYRDMVARVLAAQPSGPRLVTCPDRLARTPLRLAARVAGVSPAIVDRMYNDLVFDVSQARRDFGFAPRAFAPEPVP